MLGLLVTFFGVQQRTRPQAYFRFWFAGWVFTYISLLLSTLPRVAPRLGTLSSLGWTNAMCLGGIAFLLAFIAGKTPLTRSLVLGFSVALPASLIFALSLLRKPTFALIFALVLLFECAFIHFTFALLPRSWVRRGRALRVLALFACCLLAGLARAGRVQDLDGWIIAQLFVSAAVLYSTDGRGRTLEWLIGSLGLLCWGLFYPLSILLGHDPRLLHLLDQCWNLPKYAVGFAMTLRIFDGARNDVVSLAQRYQNLYADFRLLYQNHPLPMWIHDPLSNRFLSANVAATRSYGYTEQEFLSMSLEQISVRETIPSATEQEAHGAETSLAFGAPLLIAPDNQEGTSEVTHPVPVPAQTTTRGRHRLKDGRVISVELTEHDILFHGTEARFVLAFDVTEREAIHEQLFHRAQHDALTGLPNRMLFDDRLEQSLARCARENRKAVLFTIDADRFKLVNDTYGHLVGDETLKALAARLSTRVRSIDTFARTGGEEFAIIIGGINQIEDAEKIAGMFVHLFDTPLRLPDAQELKVSVSIGAAVFPDDAVDAQTLRKKSDQALYHAKRLGRNQFVFASHETGASFDEASAVEGAIRDALSNNALELHFQPVFNESGSAMHFEALLRMSAGNPVLYPPDVFIPIAEESGLMLHIGKWVVEQACRHLAEWRHFSDNTFKISINVSSKQVLGKGFAAFVLDTLRQHDLPPDRLLLELTESSLMADPLLMREAMQELAQSGVRFALDDFGAGNSSLSHLIELPISLLKVDRSLIEQAEHSIRTGGIVGGIIQMSATMEVDVIAEGVENEAQLKLLLRKGCNLFQGFALARPMSASVLASELASTSPQLFKNSRFQMRAGSGKRPSRMPHLPSLATGTT